MSSQARDAHALQGAALPVRVVLLDDVGETRDALVELFNMDASIQVVGSAPLADEGIRLIANVRPDVALVDVGLDGSEGNRAAREALEHSPHTKVIGLSARCDRDSVLGMFRAGAIGFVDKTSPPQQLLDAVHAASEGRSMLSPEVSGEIVVELAGRLEAEALEERDSVDRRSRIEEVMADHLAMHVVFQPIFEISTNTLVGFEALMRFLAEPRRPPNEWFDEAASVGLGGALEAEAIRRALVHLGDLPERTFLSVNASPETVRSRALEAALEGAPLERLVLELTEHDIVRDYRSLDLALDSLREEGMRLAIDDAGAGYASLRHIVRLSPDIIKLDADLTCGIESDATRRALAAAMITFASETQEEIIAEGVETAGELDALQSLGVPLAQGFLLGRPAPPPARGEVEALLPLEDAEEDELEEEEEQLQGVADVVHLDRRSRKGPTRASR